MSGGGIVPAGLCSKNFPTHTSRCWTTQEEAEARFAIGCTSCAQKADAVAYPSYPWAVRQKKDAEAAEDGRVEARRAQKYCQKHICMYILFQASPSLFGVMC